MSAANPSFSHIYYVYRHSVSVNIFYIYKYACTYAFVLINELAQNTQGAV